MSISKIKLFLSETDTLISELFEYLNTIDELLSFEENKAWQHSDNILRESFWWKTKKFKFEYFWPMAKYYSFVTLLHTIMEERLRQLCLLIQNHDEEMRKYELGNRINSYMDFIERGKWHFVKRNNLDNWQAVIDFEIVRNCIVHAFGRIEYVKSNYRERLMHILQKDKNLKIETRIPQSNQIIPTHEYCSSAVKLVRAFFKELGSHLV